MRKVIAALWEIQCCLQALSECLGYPDAALNLIPLSLTQASPYSPQTQGWHLALPWTPPLPPGNPQRPAGI